MYEKGSKGFPILDGWLPPLIVGWVVSSPYSGMGGFVSLRHHPETSSLPKAFTTNRDAIGWAFLILTCLQERALDAVRIKKACHSCDRLCDSDWIRTNDLLLRRQLLYPAELPNQELPIGGAK